MIREPKRGTIKVPVWGSDRTRRQKIRGYIGYGLFSISAPAHELILVAVLEPSMPRRVKLNHVVELLDEGTYPMSNDEARSRFEDVTLVYADGEERLTAVLDRSNEKRHESADELASELYANFPVEAVGEPGQAEGEG